MGEAQLPVRSKDQRIRTRLHALRAKAWIDRVITVSGLHTAYQLDKQFGGGQRKWKAYQSGKMPNEMTIQVVEDAYPSTRDWLERGPNGLALWPALGHSDIDVINAIANQSSSVDGQIAKLRLDAARDLIEVEYPPPMRNFQPDFRWPPVWFDEQEMADDNYMLNQQSVWYEIQLEQALPIALCEEVVDCLYVLLQPYRLNAYRKKFEEFYDEIMDTRQKFSTGQNDYEEFLYQTARMESIGNKGSRSDMVELPDAALDDKHKSKK
ncbi:hypothetical protein BN2497_11611 [Janthinobacterium sp. CG23_2]|nr:hypothetical protein BN2497_457 [Janthinobacterium sp. CG23_2]CUI03982.1 hypothetical protein BN2497_2741 [Janthinobacterium sp. CG23_2]CUI03992.1 hypothetical protein BN2497_2761 [Janthinobacterium sp. CG23_2]CUI08417.1 hypothetical protein BN2497_11611 [Janthinobacterium sp. CG23_2]CUU26626.1 hypothetical protein BN3177_457 [Janthinobacterium sp. CG23_2]